jgi:hypothetical protein
VTGELLVAPTADAAPRPHADPDVRMVTHLGDIKSGATTCDDARHATIRRDFDGFADPLVYTPGDNEWTDCHRVNNGGYHPLERLAKVRSLFFPRPGTTLGGRVPVTSQASQGLPENVRHERAGLSFATLHVVGSNHDRPLAAGSPWLRFYGVRHSADNLQRVTVDGSDLGETDWLKVTVTADLERPLSWRRVPGR